GLGLVGVDQAALEIAAGVVEGRVVHPLGLVPERAIEAEVGEVAVVVESGHERREVAVRVGRVGEAAEIAQEAGQEIELPDHGDLRAPDLAACAVLRPPPGRNRRAHVTMRRSSAPGPPGCRRAPCVRPWWGAWRPDTAPAA